MGFRPAKGLIDLDKLKTTLLISKVQDSNNPLYQVILGLIEFVKRFQGITDESINNITNNIVENITENITVTASLGDTFGLDQYEERDPIPIPMNGGSGSSGTGSGLTQPQVCKIVSLRG